MQVLWEFARILARTSYSHGGQIGIWASSLGHKGLETPVNTQVFCERSHCVVVKSVTMRLPGEIAKGRVAQSSQMSLYPLLQKPSRSYHIHGKDRADTVPTATLSPTIRTLRPHERVWYYIPSKSQVHTLHTLPLV